MPSFLSSSRLTSGLSLVLLDIIKAEAMKHMNKLITQVITHTVPGKVLEILHTFSPCGLIKCIDQFALCLIHKTTAIKQLAKLFGRDILIVNFCHCIDHVFELSKRVPCITEAGKLWSRWFPVL